MIGDHVPPDGKIPRKGDAGNLVIPHERVPVAAYQAIYHKLTGKTETINRKYAGSFLIDAPAIESIYYKLDQTIQQYNVQAANFEITISDFDGANYRFTSFEKFQFSNIKTLIKPISGFGMELDLLVVLPSELPEAECIPQTYKVLISVEDAGRIAQRHFSRSVLTIRLHEPAFPTGSATINFADYSVGRTLLSLVNDWFEEITSADEETWSIKGIKFLKWAGNWGSAIIPFSVLVGGIVFEPANYPNFFTPIRYLLAVILASFVAIGVAIYFNERMDAIADLLVSKTRFRLSSGDQKAHDHRIKARKKATARAGIIISSIVIAAIVGVFVNVITSKFFGTQ